MKKNLLNSFIRFTLNSQIVEATMTTTMITVIIIESEIEMSVITTMDHREGKNEAARRSRKQIHESPLLILRDRDRRRSRSRSRDGYNDEDSWSSSNR